MLAALIFLPLLSAKSWKDLGFAGSDQWLDEKELCCLSGVRNQLGIKHFPQVGIKLDGNLWKVLDSNLPRMVRPCGEVTSKRQYNWGPQIVKRTRARRQSEQGCKRGPYRRCLCWTLRTFLLAEASLSSPRPAAQPSRFRCSATPRARFLRATHTDFVNEQREPEPRNLQTPGNRIASAIVSLRMAKRGGGLVFPYLSSTVMLNPGDVAIFFNETPDTISDFKKNKIKKNEVNIRSTHASCPVLDGKPSSGFTLPVTNCERCPEDEKLFEITMMNYATYFDGKHHRRDH
ncbi:hypothetical protein PRIPAC_70455 [Pristionchus pacificus]|uniref:Uncharacterized protein n=1 Tax=Pristionchus pacificus TaxID=54126 RepID=A0A2A6C5H7_PRIPA|nr:hypothetical protein PRIPAC_70455 [Pristionchus pacificus]|eukprot:PDM73414.1 hypothetical protein PRIPAC_40770 [Pristionchus pacificus]